MSTDAPKVLESALKLTDAERAELAAKLLASLDVEMDSDARAKWLEEIERRVIELDTDAAKTVSWAEVRARLESRLGED